MDNSENSVLVDKVGQKERVHDGKWPAFVQQG